MYDDISFIYLVVYSKHGLFMELPILKLLLLKHVKHVLVWSSNMFLCISVSIDAPNERTTSIRDANLKR